MPINYSRLAPSTNLIDAQPNVVYCSLLIHVFNHYPYKCGGGAGLSPTQQSLVNHNLSIKVQLRIASTQIEPNGPARRPRAREFPSPSAFLENNITRYYCTGL